MALGGPTTKLNARFPIIKTVGSGTIDVASLADGAGATSTITVTGAAVGDFVLGSFGLDISGITVTYYVSATDTVSVRVQNESGGILDLTSTTVKVIVIDGASGT
jgi:hypothetical protein